MDRNRILLLLAQSKLHVLCLVLLVVGSGLVAADYSGSYTHQNPESESRDGLTPIDSNAATSIETNSSYQPKDYTVITSVQGAISAAREKGALIVVNPGGSVVYEEHKYNIYDDVDPSPEGRFTVSYVAAEKLADDDCSEFEEPPCTRNFIERLNFSTGERERLYVKKTAQVTNSRWHDADRLDEHRFLLADITNDRILIVNTTKDEIEWKWKMAEAFDPDTTGGSDPDDWAHLNDVEMLQNGYVMASPRNHDQAIFVKPGEGLNQSMTLGSDDDYEILYEQHNPDYLTQEGEPPAVIVADSQNNRIIEYSRQDGDWVETWEWADLSLRWPRDSDRLPNGNTLITDTSGNRVIEVTPSGDIVWGVRISGGYEAERLGSGDESAGGPPMTGIESAQSSTEQGIVSKLPPQARLAINGVLFVLPPWAGLKSILGGILLSGSLLAIGVSEAAPTIRQKLSRPS